MSEVSVNRDARTGGGGLVSVERIVRRIRVRWEGDGGG